MDSRITRCKREPQTTRKTERKEEHEGAACSRTHPTYKAGWFARFRPPHFTCSRLCSSNSPCASRSAARAARSSASSSLVAEVPLPPSCLRPSLRPRPAGTAAARGASLASCPLAAAATSSVTRARNPPRAGTRGRSSPAPPPPHATSSSPAPPRLPCIVVVASPAVVSAYEVRSVLVALDADDSDGS